MALSKKPPVSEREARDRVVVTGMGVVAPPGNDVPTFWQCLLDGRSTARLTDRFDASSFPCKFACHVDGFDPTRWIDRKNARRYDPFVQYAVSASRMALEDANWNMTPENAPDCGVVVGSGIGGIRAFEDECEVYRLRGVGRMSPFFIPMMISNMAAGIISITIGAKGPNMGVVSACTTSSHAIGEAYWMIRRGDARAMIAGGSEAAIRPLALGGFSAARTLSTRNDDPKRASRPFDKDRDGFVIGEGSGVIMLEALDCALERGARIYGELAGYGLSADAYHITAPPPDGDGAVRAMRSALACAGLDTTDIQYINAHGTSTATNDKTETTAIKQVFGDYAYKLAVSSTKSVTGHLLGAAGGIEAIATVMALRDQVLPPTINYETPDPECDLDYVPNKPRRMENLNAALSNSFGFGGQNACLVFVRYKS